MAAAAGLRTIKIVFDGDTKKFDAATASMSDKFKKFGAAVSLAAVGAAAGLVKLGSDFQKAYGNIIAATGATGDALAGLKKDFKAVATTGPEDFDTVSVAIGEMNTRLGLTGKPLQDATRQMLDLARITGSDVKSTITDTTRLFGDWGVTLDEQSAVMDKLFQSTKDTGIGLGDLSQSVVTFGAPLRQMGFSLDESISIFGKWQKEGVNTTTVMSGFRAMLSKTARAGKDPAKEFAKVSKAIKAAGSAGEANTIALEAFGAKAGADMAAAIREGRFELGDMVKSLENSGGSIKDVSDRTKTLEQRMAELKNKGFVALEPVATRMFQVAMKLVDAFAKFQAWAERNQTTVKILAGVVGALTGVVLALMAAFKVAALYQWLFVTSVNASTGAIVRQSVASRIAAGVTKAWTAVQRAFNAVMNAHPAIRITLLVIALGAALFAVWKKSETFRAITTAAFNAVKNAASAAFGWVKQNWPLILGILTGPIGLAVLAVVKNFDRIKAAASRIKAALVTAFAGVTEVITAPFRAAVEGIRSAWNSTIGGKGFSFGGWDPPGPGSVPGISFTIPRLAAGGTAVRGGWAMVGERGPELLNLGRGAQVVPLDRADGGPQVLHLTLDLGHGIRQVVEIDMRESNRRTRSALIAGAQRAI